MSHSNPLSQAPRYARGKMPALIDGIVRGPGGPRDDRVSAKISADEAILPARTVQAIGGPAAIKRLIEQTNDGVPPESDVHDGGRYADGAVPGFADDFRNALSSGAPIKQDLEDLGTLAADTIAQARRPVDALVSGVQDSAAQIGRASRQAIGDFSDKTRLMPDVPAADQDVYQSQQPQKSASNPLAQPLISAAAAQSAPPVPPNPLAAAARPGPITRLPSPGGETEISRDVAKSSGPLATARSGFEDSMRQIANIRALREPAAERLATNGTNWEADERQRRADFDAFTNRASLSSAVRDASLSGNAQRVQAAGQALAQFDAAANQPVNAAAERQNRVQLQELQGDRAREVAQIQGQNALSQVVLQGRNQLAAVGAQGENALSQEAIRGQNALAATRAAKELNPLDQQIKELSLSDAQTRAGLRQRLMSASPEDQQAIARQIAALDGRFQDPDNTKALAARAGLVGELAKAYNGPMGAPMGADKQPIPFDKFAAPALAAAFGGGQQQAPQAPAFSDYAAQVRARNPGQRITDEQIQAAYAQRYGK